MMLALILLLPFIGSICAAMLPSNARNGAAWLAGAFALTPAVLIALLYGEVVDGLFEVAPSDPMTLFSIVALLLVAHD